MYNPVTTNKEAIAEFGKPFCLAVYEAFSDEETLSGICLRINSNLAGLWGRLFKQGNRVMINKTEDLAQCISAGEEISINMETQDDVINNYMEVKHVTYHDDYKLVIEVIGKFEKEFAEYLNINSRVDIIQMKEDVFNLRLDLAIDKLVELLKEYNTPIYILNEMLKHHDWFYYLSEDNRVYDSGLRSHQRITDYARNIPSEYQEEANKLMDSYHQENKI